MYVLGGLCENAWEEAVDRRLFLKPRRPDLHFSGRFTGHRGRSERGDLKCLPTSQQQQQPCKPEFRETSSHMDTPDV